jgi:histidine ammonia-lyase
MLATNNLKTKIKLGSNSRLNLADCRAITLGMYRVEIDEVVVDKMQQSYKFLNEKIDKRLPIYGINTQFGDQVNLVDKEINSHPDLYYASIRNRQINLIKSHHCGMGEMVPSEIVILAMMLRAHCLSQGFSGVSPGAVTALMNFINNNIVPVVHRHGSIGASGDLVPLSAIATALIGEDTKVWFCNKLTPAKDAIKEAGLIPLIPDIRDGLALINGTSFMSAIASLAIHDLNRIFKQMLSAIAMTLEAMQIIHSAYHPLVHQLKNHLGSMRVNEFLTNFFIDSQLLTDLDELRESNHQPVQDCYSLRSIAQGFGPFSENLENANIAIENEINSVNDNPIIDVENQKIHHGANFMGYHITNACDILKMDIAQASSWIHALLANLVHPRKSKGLPTSLVDEVDKYNGFRPLQLLAASITVQNRKLAQIQQAFMLPTEGDNQDVNSLGTHAAFDLRDAVFNLEHLTSILLLAATQALEFRGIKKASSKAQKIYQQIRAIAPVIGECRPLAAELNKLSIWLRKDEIA